MQMEAGSGSLSEEHSFVLCDACDSGFPIRHVSKGFKDMLHLSSEDVQTKTNTLSTWRNVRDCKAAIEAAALSAGLPFKLAAQAIEVLEDVVAAELRAIAFSEAEEKAASVLQLKAKSGGELLVCELTILVTRHSSTGSSYLVARYKDVSRWIPVKAALQAAIMGAPAVSALLTGLKDAGAHHEALLADPASASGDPARDRAAFNEVWRKFLTAKDPEAPGMGTKASRDSSGSGATGEKDGKHNKKRSARSESSKASTAKGVPARQKNRGERTQTVPSNEPPLFQHFLDIMEPTGTRISRILPAEVSTLELEPQPLIFEKELLDLQFPAVIFDPLHPGAPAVACSPGMIDLLGYSSSQGLLRSLSLDRMVADLDSVEKRREFGELCMAAAWGAYYYNDSPKKGHMEYGLASARALPGGELVCTATTSDRSEETLKCMVYYKQAELNNRMHVLCLKAKLKFPNENPSQCLEDRRCAFLRLSDRMDTLEQTLAERFWYSAPMRRQISRLPAPSRPQR